MLPCQRHLFDIPREIAYLNNAAYSPLPRPVREAGEAGVAAKSTPWTMNPAGSEAAARAAAARCIGAEPQDIAIVPSVAYAIATAAANLPVPPGSRILLMEGEFPSQSIVWAQRATATGATLDIVPRPADGDWTAALLARIEQPGLPPISVAALTPVHWTDGALVAIDRLAPPLHAAGAAVVVDATQAAGILPLDVAALGVDFLAFPTYKWVLGPYTLAFLYAAPHRQAGTPLEWHNANHLDAAGPFRGTLPGPSPTACRFDMGERLNPVTLPMAVAGMDLLEGWGRPAMRERLRSITDALAEAAAASGWAALPPTLRPPHILGLRPPLGTDAASTAARLAAAGVHVAERGGVLRLGVHVFNDEDDVARFAAAIAG